MKLEVEDISSVEKKITVLIPPSVVDGETDNAYRQLNKKVKIRGFRPGKIPRSILEMHYKDQVNNDVASRLINDAYAKILKENKFVPLTQPVIDSGQLKKGQELNCSFGVGVEPIIELKNYLGMEIEKREESPITPDAISNRLKQLQEANAQLKEVVEDRPLREGDFALIDFEGSLEGKPFKGNKINNWVLEVRAGSFLPGFAEKLVGLKKGEEKDISVSFPDDHERKDLVGREVVFKVCLKGIKEKIIPDLDDDFAKDLGEFDTLENLREKTKKNLEDEESYRVKREVHDKIIEKLLTDHYFESPPSLVERQAEAIQANTLKELKRKIEGPEESKLSDNALKEECRKKAKKQIKTSLLLGEIARKESLKITDEEIQKRLADIAVQANQTKEMISDYYREKNLFDILASQILEEKTLAFLAEKAKIIA